MEFKCSEVGMYIKKEILCCVVLGACVVWLEDWVYSSLRFESS